MCGNHIILLVCVIIVFCALNLSAADEQMETDEESQSKDIKAPAGKDRDLFYVVLMICSGIAGVVLTLSYKAYRSRIPPVGIRVHTIPVFTPEIAELKTYITVSDGDDDFQFHNLFLIELMLRNNGSRDMDSFPCGITLPNGGKAIHVEYTSADRNHRVEFHTQIHPSAPVSEIDCSLVPFNRKDFYLFKMYIIADEIGTRELSDLEVSSPKPMKLVKIQTFSEVMGVAFGEMMGGMAAGMIRKQS